MAKHHARTSIRRLQRGLAAVEFGLLISPLVLMTFGATEFGRAIYTYNTLDKAVRNGVRHLSQHGPGDATAQAEAVCLVTHGTPDCSGTVIAPGLTSSNVVLCDAIACPGSHSVQPTGSGTVNLVSISIQNYSYNSLVEFVMPDLTFNTISVTMRAQL